MISLFFCLFVCFNYWFLKFIYLFIYGCVGSSFLCEGFLQLWQAGATLHCGARASHYRWIRLVFESPIYLHRGENSLEGLGNSGCRETSDNTNTADGLHSVTPACTCLPSLGDWVATPRKCLQYLTLSTFREINQRTPQEPSPAHHPL